MKFQFRKMDEVFSARAPYIFLGLCLIYGSLIGCTSTPTVAKEDLLIAVVDFQRVLEETRDGKELKDVFDSFMKDRQVLLELEQQEIQRIRNNLVNQGSVLSDSARQEREAQFQLRVRDYQQKEAALSRELQEKQKDLMDGFRSDVERVVSQIAEDRNFAIVIQRGNGTSTLYHRSQLDISDDIIQEMDRDDS
ncbi:MAG: OmpH family outer membrane protein [Nitrospirales bacterium]